MNCFYQIKRNLTKNCYNEKFSIVCSICFSFLFSCSGNRYNEVDSIESKIDSIIALMTIEEKIGQMTQSDQQFLDTIQDLADYGIGSLLSGGGSNPDTNHFEAWADMYDQYQKVAMSSRLGIPLIYGVDAVHGHNNVLGATIFPHNVGLAVQMIMNCVERFQKQLQLR